MPIRADTVRFLWVAAVVCTAFASASPAAEPILLPNGQALHYVDFDRHVVPLLSRFGCNTGSCHGSFQGRGDMRLSLFGHSAKMDYDALSPRIDSDDPEESLALLKPSGQTEHEGGVRFEKDSWPYRVILRWIQQGGERNSTGVDQVRLKVVPEQLEMRDDQPRPLVVLASFDGQDFVEVTPFCRFTSGDEGLLAVSDSGCVTSVRPGASHIVVQYLGQFATVLAARQLESSTDPAPQLQQNNYIDRLINQRLQQLGLSASPPSSDQQFLRRLTLDVVGRLPTRDEIHRFADDRSPDRRRRVIDRLLVDNRHAALWATRFCDFTKCAAEELEGPADEKPQRAKMWHDWFKVRFQRNVPYDEIVRGVICGTSVGGRGYDQWLEDEADLVRAARAGIEFDYARRDFLDLYWRRTTRDGQYPRQRLAEITSAAFLGIQVECSQCHKHPYDRWTQADYRGFVNIFSQVHFGSSTKLNAHILQLLQQRRTVQAATRPERLPRVREVFNSSVLSRPLVDEASHLVLAPQPLGGSSMEDSSDPRQQLMDWLTDRGKRQFAQNLVNRVWAHYFGRGIVEPVDGFSAINPPTHPELLDRLATEFIDSGYDIRRVELTILESAAYQRSSASRGNNSEDLRHYARSYVRPLLAEVAVDVLHTALGVPLEHSGQLPGGAAAIELADDQPDNSPAARMLRTFGRGPRKAVCDCDRQRDPSLRQALFLMSDPWIIESIQRGELFREVRTVKPREAAIQGAFLRALARPPTQDESLSATAQLASSADDDQAWIDIIWALINTREFLTNR